MVSSAWAGLSSKEKNRQYHWSNKYATEEKIPVTGTYPGFPTTRPTYAGQERSGQLCAAVYEKAAAQ